MSILSTHSHTQRGQGGRLSHRGRGVCCGYCATSKGSLDWFLDLDLETTHCNTQVDLSVTHCNTPVDLSVTHCNTPVDLSVTHCTTPVDLDRSHPIVVRGLLKHTTTQITTQITQI